MKWIKRTVIAFLYVLSACGNGFINKRFKTVASSEESVSNYHITVNNRIIREGIKTPGAQTVASASAWKDGTDMARKSIKKCW